MTGMAIGAAAVAGAGLGWWGCIAIAAFGICGVLMARGQPSALAQILILAAALMGAWRYEHVDLPSLVSVSVPDTESVLVVSDPRRTIQYQHFVAELPSPAALAPGGPSTRVCITGDAMPLVHLGDRLRINGAIRDVQDVSIGQRAYLEARSCSGSVFAASMLVTGRSDLGISRVIADLRWTLGSVLRETAPGDAGVLLSGLVTGDDAGLSEERKAAFVRTGTTHLTAVSGSNLALVAGILATIGTATLGRHRAVWQVVTIAGVWAYAILSGTQAPAVRAAIVASLAILAFRVGRRPDYPTLILLAAGGMALLDPLQVESLGFRLSVASSLALSVVLPRIIQRGGGSGLASVVAATAAAQIATLPILLPLFGTVPLLGLPANVLVAPLIVVAMPLAAVAGLIGLVSIPAAQAAAVPAALAAHAALAIVDALGTPRGYVGVGMPPLIAAIPLAVASFGVLLVVGDEVQRGIRRNCAAVPREKKGHGRGEHP